MAGNTFGQAFTLTTFGESHGLAMGAVVDGCPPGLPLAEEDLQTELDRRRPGRSRYTTQRREPDAVKILSGVFEGVTTGTPIGLVIEKRRPAPPGLRGHQGPDSPVPRRLHLSQEVWAARLPGWGTRLRP